MNGKSLLPSNLREGDKKNPDSPGFLYSVLRKVPSLLQPHNYRLLQVCAKNTPTFSLGPISGLSGFD